MMLPSTVPAMLLVAQSTIALSAHGMETRDSKPKLPYDQNTTPFCTWWLDYETKTSCSAILEENYISIDTFSRWNPTIAQDCAGMEIGKSYCVEAAFEPTVSSTTTTTTTTSVKPTTTKPSNGIETPMPIQPGMVSDCDKFYLVKRGDTCAAIVSQHGITENDFGKWNPKVGGSCAGLWADTYACVSVIGYKPTPTDPGNGIETPTPAQPGMLNNCIKFHLVQPGESCADMAEQYGISVTDVVAWNPRAGRNCEALWANAHACVGMPAFRVSGRYSQGCRGETYGTATVARVAVDGVCVNTDCRVGSLDIAAEGVCPDGQVQISYWEQPGCQGHWFGYGYASRGTCRGVWSQGWKFKSLHFRCISSAEDCVNKGTCTYDAEPESGSC